MAAAPTNTGDQSDVNVMNFPPSPPFFSTLSSLPPPSPPLYFPTSSNSMVVYTPSPPRRSPSPSNLIVVYQRSGQSSMHNPLLINQQQRPLTPAAPPISRTNPHAGISQRPTNSGELDSATEDLDVMSFLNLSQWSPPRDEPLEFVSQPSGQSSMDNPPRNQHQQEDYIERPPFIAGYMALIRQWLLQFFIDESDNLSQNLECPGMSLLYLYVEDEFYKLYLHAESWKRLKLYMYRESIMIPQMEILWMWPFQVENYGHAFVASVKASMGAWRIGPREWVAKFRYQRRSLPTPFFIDNRGHRHVNMEVYYKNKHVVLEDARLHFPDLLQVYRKTESIFQEKNPNKSYDKVGIIQLYTESQQAKLGVTYDTNSGVVEEITTPGFLSAARRENPGEDFVSGEVEPVGIGGEGTDEAEIAGSQLNPGPYGNRKENTARGGRGNKKTTRIRNVRIPLENILKVKKMCLKVAAGNLKVSQSALKRACREHGINRWPPRNKHEGTGKSLPNETPAVVDQEGIPQLTSDTLPSDQALMANVVTSNTLLFDQALMANVDTNSVAEEADQALTTNVDTNSVVEETAPLQFLPTVRQENTGEDYGNDEVEAVGLGAGEIGEGEMKRNEKASGGERGKYKTTGVRIEIALEEILRYKEMHLKDAAKELKVGRSTLKRICRDYNIHRWPPREDHKLISQSQSNESPIVVDQERTPQLNCNTLLPSIQITDTGDTNSVTVKAKYKGLRIKFQLSSPWRKVELEQEVKKRLQLDGATYYINYKDEDDEMTLIGCDEDLEGYISSSSTLGTRSIELFLEPK